jgi:hypothetical protein
VTSGVQETSGYLLRAGRAATERATVRFLSALLAVGCAALFWIRSARGAAPGKRFRLSQGGLRSTSLSASLEIM